MLFLGKRYLNAVLKRRKAVIKIAVIQVVTAIACYVIGVYIGRKSARISDCERDQ